MRLPDIHKDRPDVEVPLQKVGVSSVKMPLTSMLFEDRPVTILPVLEAYIDLPMDVKGMHASRSYEVIMTVLRRRARGKYRLEDICASMVRDLLAKHGYATRAEIRARGEIIYERSTPNTKIRTYEGCDITASAVGVRGAGGSAEVRRAIGVGVTGITACPCAQEVLRGISERELAAKAEMSKGMIKELFKSLPLATHMQRAYGSIVAEVAEGAKMDVRQLVRVVEGAMSSPTFGLLKRADEAEVVREALHKPRFAEDCVRYMARNFMEEFPELPDSTQVSFSLRSLESIHKHDFVAEMNTSLGEVRRHLDPRPRRARP